MKSTDKCKWCDGTGVIQGYLCVDCEGSGIIGGLEAKRELDNQWDEVINRAFSKDKTTEYHKISIVGDKVEKVVQRFVDSGMFLRQCYQIIISSHDTGLDMETLYYEIMQETYRYPYHFTITRLSDNHEYYILEVS